MIDLGDKGYWGEANLGTKDHCGVASFVGRIYIGDHKPLLLTKYISDGPHGFREEDF